MLTSAKVSLRETFADVDAFKLSYGPQSRFIVILFVGVLLLNLMALR